MSESKYEGKRAEDKMTDSRSKGNSKDDKMSKDQNKKKKTKGMSGDKRAGKITKDKKNKSNGKRVDDREDLSKNAVKETEVKLTVNVNEGKGMEDQMTTAKTTKDSEFRILEDQLFDTALLRFWRTEATLNAWIVVIKQCCLTSYC